MLRLIITKPAEQQLSQIATWTLNHWGEAQIDEYKLKLELGLLNILENNYIGKKSDEIEGNIRKFLVEGHWIFYEVTSNAIIVHGFLHTNQNPKLHL